MLTIDGSQGEGGGQILRTALALALITRTPFRLHSIRAGRSKPGLMRQHLTAVEAAAAVGSARVRGGAIGSREIRFEPGDVCAGEFQFSIGTAGSTTLILQTILPPLLLASGPSRIVLEGGTHNPHAPPFDFLQKTFLPLINRMGPTVAARLERAGFYPAGGGRLSVEIRPAAALAPLSILERGPVSRKRAAAMIAGLPDHIAERELGAIQEALGWEKGSLAIVRLESAGGPGNAVTLEIESEHVTEVFTGFGQRGVRAEAVARQAIDEARDYLAAGAPVGLHLADQLLLPLALAGGGSFLTMPPTRHTRTNIDVIGMFLPIKASVEKVGGQTWRIDMGT